MTIRSQISLFLLAAFALVVVATEVVQRYVVYPGFESLERSEAATDADRAVQALQREVEHLSNFCLDWSAWDDMYQYVQDKNKDFETANFDETDYFKRCNLPVLYVYNAAGELVWGKTFDLESMEEGTLELFSSAPLTGHPLAIADPGAADVNGIIQTERGPLMVSSRQIVKSDLAGPPIGRLVFGRFLDEAAMGKLAEQTSVTTHAWPVGGRLPAEVAPALGVLRADSQAAHIATTSDKLLHVYRLIPGVRDQDALVMRAEVSRGITAHGAKTIGIGRVSMLAAAVGMLALLVFLMNARVGRPLAKLTAHATRVGATGDLTARVKSERPDEIGQLAGEFDRMVERLAESQASLTRASRAAGMADVASSVLHNVGNALNSAAVTAGVMRRSIADSRLPGLVKVGGLIKAQPDAAAFFANDPRGKQIPAYIVKASEELEQERARFADEADRLDQSLRHIQEIIRAQQAHASAPEVVEPVLLSHVVSQVRTVVGPSFERHGVTLRVTVPADLTLRVDRSRLEQVLVNLLTNAKQASVAGGSQAQGVELDAFVTPADRVVLEVKDQGIGFSPEAKAKLFTQGFTTRAEGHGVGLHYCAVTMAQLGGVIEATSPGNGAGATFRLELPRQPAEWRLAA